MVTAPQATVSLPAGLPPSRHESLSGAGITALLTVTISQRCPSPDGRFIYHYNHRIVTRRPLGNKCGSAASRAREAGIHTFAGETRKEVAVLRVPCRPWAGSFLWGSPGPAGTQGSGTAMGTVPGRRSRVWSHLRKEMHS